MTNRCHLYLPLVDSGGTLYPYTQVTLLDPATNQPITTPVYDTPTDGTPITFPAFFDPAVVDLWVDTPMRVTLVAVMSQDVTITLPNLDIAPAPESTITTDHPLRLIRPNLVNPDAVLVAGFDGLVSWQLSDAFAHHNHSGDGPQSVVAGVLDPTNWASQQVWVGSGVGTISDSGADEVGIGLGASPRGPEAVALGSGATPQTQAIAVGPNAQSSAGAVALGSAASSMAQNQVVIGRSSSASALGGVVVGSAVSAASLALGAAVRDDNAGNLLIGTGAVPDTTGWTGPFMHLLGNSVVVPWYLSARDALIGGGPSLVGFYGRAGGNRGLIDGTAATGATLSLLQALDGLGLVFLITGSTYSDNMVDFNQMTSHDATLAFDTTNSANFEGRTSRLKRTSDVPSSFSYTRPADIKNFCVAMYAQTSNTTPSNSISVTAATNSTGTPVAIPVACTTQVTTAGGWYRVNAFPVRDLPAGLRYITFTIKNDTSISGPQVGKIWFK